ncbi:hypothetical protein RBG61_11120 [Paludicola sp. MB14-C6]|uniref:hypothetical protein n=1 Tax=Paludihabitans sp. MB14-C6 TaxID=3070656 RepID=UPI0027DE5A7D|nr:hypothetical protein [Paludicola sp. MB14-C6]WMJ22535.1 hypothetical protein RBG61_11120 [Paludicola sp. MB14-C6]
MDFNSTNEINNNEAQPNNQPQCQKAPQICPRCRNICNDRFCLFCGFDLAAYQQQNQNYYQQNQANYQYQNFYNPNQAYYQQSPFQAAAKTQNKKTHIWPFVLGGLVLITAMISGIIFFAGLIFKNSNLPLIDENPGIFNNQENGTIPNGISKQELKNIMQGMSYAHVSSIIGGDGVLTDQGETPLEENYYTYQWIGENNPNASVFITFVNDKVSEIVNNGV